jgi:hypothetical protein
MPEELALIREELAVYGELKKALLKHHAGQFVLIKGREMIGTFPDFREAFEEGVRRFGHSPMLIKQITSEERAEKLPVVMHGLIRAHP